MGIWFLRDDGIQDVIADRKTFLSEKAFDLCRSTTYSLREQFRLTSRLAGSGQNITLND